MRAIINHTRQWLCQKGAWVLHIAVAIAVPLIASAPALAASGGAGPDFNIQVSPSPLVVTLKPGKAQNATLTVRNVSNHVETLYPRLSGFHVDKQSRDIRLTETAPADMASWVTFKNASLTMPAGATQQLTVQFNTPNDVGFSYSAAITLARSPDNPIDSDGLHLRGAVAVFCLVNIDRPGATSSLGVSGLKSDKSQYQFLPAHFSLAIQNRGNVISQPSGSLFIQRSFDSTTPIATLPVNSANKYVLTGTSRDFTVGWNSGFPRYITDANGQRHLQWDWKHLNELRFGRYVAKAVIIYNDGQRDIPVVTATTFWVIPWTLLIGILIITFILVMGVIGWGRLLFKGTRKVGGYAIRRRP